MIDVRKAQMKVGMMVLAALAIVIFTILWGKHINITRNYRTVKVKFNNVVGLEKGARVLVNGMEMGQVVDFNLLNDGVLVELNLAEKVPLHSDASAYIETPDLMGEKVISLIPGISEVMFAEGDTILGRSPLNYERLLTLAGDLSQQFISSLEEIRITSQALKRVLENPALNDELTHSLEDLSVSASALRNIIENNRGRIDSSFTHLNSISSQVDYLLKQHNSDIETLLSDLKRLSLELKDFITSANEHSLALQEQEGTLGKLLYRDDIYSEIRRVTANLDSLINEIRQKGVKTHIKLF